MSNELEVKQILHDKQDDSYTVQVVYDKAFRVNVYFRPKHQPYAGDPIDIHNGKSLQRIDLPGRNNTYRRIYALAGAKLKSAKLKMQGQQELFT
jgi:hypothetical protein